MPKFFNASRGPVTATIGNDVIMFPAKAWTVLDDDLGISASLQSLMDQRILILSQDTTPLKAAVPSKPKAPHGAKATPQPTTKVETSKVVSPKDATKIQTPEPAPAPAPTTSKV